MDSQDQKFKVSEAIGWRRQYPSTGTRSIKATARVGTETYTINIERTATPNVLLEEFRNHIEGLDTQEAVNENTLELLQIEEISPTNIQVREIQSPKASRNDYQDARPSASSSKHRKSHSWEINLICVRWITLRDALERPLDDIVCDKESFFAIHTLSDLKQQASNRLSPTEDQRPSDAKHAECYLRNCHLSITTAKESMTLGDLGVKGSRKEPLDVFIVPFDASSPIQPHLLTTESQMVLEDFLGRIGESSLMEAVFEALLRMTHFPPVVFALYDLVELHRYGAGSDLKSNWLAKSILLDCFLRLEHCRLGSHQVTSGQDLSVNSVLKLKSVASWLEEISGQLVEPYARPDQPRIVRSVNKIRYKSEATIPMASAPEDVNIPPSVEICRQTRVLEIQLDSLDDISPPLVALALYSDEVCSANFWTPLPFLGDSAASLLAGDPRHSRETLDKIKLNEEVETELLKGQAEPTQSQPPIGGPIQRQSSTGDPSRPHRFCKEKETQLEEEIERINFQVGDKNDEITRLKGEILELNRTIHKLKNEAINNEGLVEQLLSERELLSTGRGQIT